MSFYKKKEEKGHESDVDYIFYLDKLIFVVILCTNKVEVIFEIYTLCEVFQISR